MKKFILIAAVIAAFESQSQISHGGRPSFADEPQWIAAVNEIVTPAIPLEELRAADRITDQYKDLPYRFGYEHAVAVDMTTAGTWSDQNGTRFCHLAIECPGALAISLRFDSFKLPKGSQLFISSPDGREFLGSFDHRNNKSHGRLACGLIQGERIIIEYSAPTTLAEQPALVIGEIVHGYRPFAKSSFVQDALRGPFGSSGACEVNVNCPEGADWQVEKRSVAIITQGGSGLCTGAMVNNTANDGTPYFLTANHCTQGSNTGNWVFYFNHESAGCNGSNGPTTDLISGADLVANNAGSDFALLLLNDTPPASYNVQYAGWDATDDEAASTSAVCIHHPSGDIKKISFEDDAPYFSTGNGAAVWWIDNWELGVTEPGSSGSPLFNQDHRIIGQLFGGASACSGAQGNGQYDFYGRFGVSWNTGNSAPTRLIDWLDPAGTGQLVLDGWPEGAVVYTNDAGVGAISGIEDNICGDTFQGTFNLTNNGTETLTACEIHYQLNNGSESVINWTGSLAQNQTESIQLPVMTASNGNNTLTINVIYSADENAVNNSTSFSFIAITTPTTIITMQITLDNYPEETAWSISDNNGVEILTGGPYSSESPNTTITEDHCLAYGCYSLTITDAYGDGICCSFGNGDYQLANENQEILASGGQFTDSETTDFCLELPIGVINVDTRKVSLFPNPANDRLQMVTQQRVSEITIRDINGTLTALINPQSMNVNMDVSQYSPGIYFAQFKFTDGSTFSEKVVIIQ